MSELRLETYQMPAADLGLENPLPPLKSGKDLHAISAGVDIPDDMVRNMAYGRLPNIMPYSVQDGYLRKKQPKDFRVAILENETLKATFLLELGGRLWSLYHKPAQRELLYVNPVFQPVNLALRNAWFSGGVEWNIGTIGHFPFTCDPIFAARIEMPDGVPVLRMYERERFRQTPFQIDAYLLGDSPVLYIRVRIVNPHDNEIPMYWWSNIAVPETPSTRVMVPSNEAYRFAYEENDLGLIPTPLQNGEDYTYPTQIQNSADYFFNIPDGHRPWITALDEDGKGLIQVSTSRLKGRKLFLWGMGAGGRKWQEFLSQPGEAYIELQAGLARTQMEHIPMPPKADWSWLEAYGLMDADPTVIHGNDWQLACQTVENELEQLIPKAKLEDDYQRGVVFQDQPPDKNIQYGSGWGRLEIILQKANDESLLSLPGVVFPHESLSEEQYPWVKLLQNGVLPPPDHDKIPQSFIIHDDWKQKLERSVKSGKGNWYAWYQLGNMRAYAGDRAGARQAWLESLKIAPTPWALRNLALFALEDGRYDEAVSSYTEAIRMKPDLRSLAVECGKAMIQSGQHQNWLVLLIELPDQIRKDGRVRLLEAQAALEVGDFLRVEKFFEDKVVMPDIREGEVSLSDIWYEYHTRRLSIEEKVQISDNLRSRVFQEYPVPAHLDFRMKVTK